MVKSNNVRNQARYVLYLCIITNCGFDSAQNSGLGLVSFVCFTCFILLMDVIFYVQTLLFM